MWSGLLEVPGVKKRPFELLFVVALVALAVAHFPERVAQEPVAATTPMSTVALAPSSVEFELSSVDGENYRYQADGQRWTFITLTAMSCGDCVRRQELDQRAMEAVEKSGGRTVALLLFGNVERAAQFASQYPSRAEAVLVDPQAQVGVKQLRGSDSSCWLLIAPDGSLAWQGQPDLETLLSKLPPR